MSKFIKYLLIFLLFFQSFSSHKGFLEFSNAKADETVDYVGNYSGIVATEQIALAFVLFNGSFMITRCIKAASVGCKCRGWSADTAVAAMVALVTGEIMAHVSFSSTKEELDELMEMEHTGKQVIDKEAIRKYYGECEYVGEDYDDGSEEYTNRKNACMDQIKPLENLRDIMTAQRDTVAVKKWLYGVGAAALVAASIIEGSAEAIAKTDLIMADV